MKRVKCSSFGVSGDGLWKKGSLSKNDSDVEK